MPVGDRPRQPPLAARGVSRSPLTPKIASKGHPMTPQVRRGQPATAFLASNVTPRSGHRQNRVESVTSTPSGTPNAERSEWDAVPRLGLGIASASVDDLPRQTQSQVELASEQPDPKFFYASDAKAPQPNAVPRPASVPQRQANNFFYANGTADAARAASNVSLATQEAAASKFFYANGTPDVLVRPSLPHSGPASTISSAPRIIQRPPPPSTPAVQRPASPIKAASTPNTQTIKTNTPGSASPQSPKRSSQGSLTSPPLPLQKRVSIDAPDTHSRNHSITEGPIPRITSPTSDMTLSPPFSPGLSGMTMASILQMAEDVDEPRDSDAVPEVHSPTKSISLSESVTELVNNARRERKVQDLEITNASLEAINRTLERQLRKQTAELRRYKRLSRTGALSVASSRVTSLAMSEPPGDTSDGSDDDEDEDDYDDSLDDSDLSSNDTMNTEDIMMPGAKVEARRRRDERRLQLDLTKHQELLIDSQKMNQSIKRCMDFTESLIKEGQKALQYHVRVSDVKFGGRVLTPDDDEEDDTLHSMHSEEAALEPPREKSSQDRDSGIELQAMST